MSSTNPDKENILFRKRDKRESESVYNIREESWRSYKRQILPDRTSALWRFSDPEDYLLKPTADLMRIIPPMSDNAEIDSSRKHSEYSAYGYNRADYMTFALLDDELIKQGVVFKNLFLAALENETVVKKYLGHLVGENFGKFEAFNSALWNSGLFLYVPDNVTIEKPIRLQRHPSGPRTILRLLVVIGKNSELTIIDDYSGECRDEQVHLNAVNEIFLGQRSKLHYANILRLSDNCRSYLTQRIAIESDASANSSFVALGGKNCKANIGAILNGRGANSELSGIVFGSGEQHFDIHTLHHHAAPDTSSDIKMKVVLGDNAVSSYTGLIDIEKLAPGCTAYQENRNLLLSETARAESIPELEIKCDQVQCSHGATMGPIDPEMLFYLKSRGVSHNEAIRLILTGFLGQLILPLPDDIRDVVESMIETKLKGSVNG